MRRDFEDHSWRIAFTGERPPLTVTVRTRDRQEAIHRLRLFIARTYDPADLAGVRYLPDHDPGDHVRSLLECVQYPVTDDLSPAIATPPKGAA